jgi:hypothetical protein
MLFFVALTMGCLADPDSEDDNYADKVIQADRPIIVRVPDLENHHQQIELDVLVTRSRDGTPVKVRFPFLYRIDSGPDTEFRVSSDFLTLQSPNVGFGDVSLGFKWHFAPNTSLIGALELPVGSAGFADAGVEPTLTVSHSIPLHERWEIVLNASMSLERDSDSLDYYGEFNGAAQLGYSITPTTQLTAAVLVKTPDALDGGITRLSGAVGLGHDLDVHNRLNLTIGRSFSSTGDDYLFLFGWAHKI